MVTTRVTQGMVVLAKLELAYPSELRTLDSALRRDKWLQSLANVLNGKLPTIAPEHMQRHLRVLFPAYLFGEGTVDQANPVDRMLFAWSKVLRHSVVKLGELSTLELAAAILIADMAIPKSRLHEPAKKLGALLWREWQRNGRHRYRQQHGRPDTTLTKALTCFSNVWG